MDAEGDLDELHREVLACRACEGLASFERPATALPFFRFPAVIGTRGDVGVLFVGTNPRVSPSNRALHERILQDRCAFDALSRNRVADRTYIGLNGEERHYRRHARLVADVYGEVPFERVAAVSELFLCASESSAALPDDRRRCADRFLARVVAVLRPRVIVAVGVPAEAYLAQVSRGSAVAEVGGHRVAWVAADHPNRRGDIEPSWRAATSFVAERLGRQALRPAAGAATAADGRALVVREVHWSDRYGWKPHQRPVDLDLLDASPGSTVRFVLLRDGGPVFHLEMTATEWRACLGSYVEGPTWRKNGYAVSLTRTTGGRATEDFVDRWRPFVRPLGGRR